MALLRYLAAIAFTTATVCAACARISPGDPNEDAGRGDTGSNVSPATCPVARPEEGATCTHPEGTTCAYGTCATYATCSGGTWRVAPTPRAARLCPSLVPEEGATCAECFEDGGTCIYGDPTCGDAATNAALANCRAGRFTVRVVTCVEAGADGGADSARDARPDGASDAANDGDAD